jgi:Predicted AAA-ATPase
MMTMIQKYPVGIQDFQKLRSEKYTYIDKTSFVWKIANGGGYYFLSRPRRFGKSLLVSTLDYLFQSKKELFEGLDIYDKWDWSQTNPVIKISFSNIGHKEKGLKLAINDNLDAIATKHGITLKETFNSGKFKELIETLSEKLGKVVVLIDEYDKPIIDYLGTNTPQAVENREILKSFYSILKDADPYLRMVFITGVSKFTRVSIFSDLNNLKDLSIDNNFESICGINQEELESNFVEELKIHDAEKIKKWYNGYSWGGGSSVYNPFSLLNFFAGDGGFKNYWFDTGTPTFLINLAQKEHLYDFESITISPNRLSAYDIEKLQIIPLMFQTGYLTIRQYIEEDDLYVLSYPNEEVRKSFLIFLSDSYTDNNYDSVIVLATQMRNALRVADIKK